MFPFAMEECFGCINGDLKKGAFFSFNSELIHRGVQGKGDCNERLMLFFITYDREVFLIYTFIDISLYIIDLFFFCSKVFF